MSFKDKIKAIMNAPEDEDYEDVMDETEDYEEEETSYAEPDYYSSPSSSSYTSSYSYDSERSAPKPSRPSHDRSAKSSRSRSNSSSGVVDPMPNSARLRVVLLYPNDYHEGRNIADQLLARNTVVVNMENVSKENSCRLLDCLSGVAYAINGHIQQIAKGTYMLTPPGVDFSGQAVDGFDGSDMYL